MNFLAHQYLSGNDEQLRVGNFIGDYVKGRKYQDYPARVCQGILLHRKIDSFTDKHQLVKQGVARLRPAMGRYASVVIDVVYDHMLASNWCSFHPDSLADFSAACYGSLRANLPIMPARVQGFLPRLIASKRFEGYATREGLWDTLDRMSRHTSLPSGADAVLEVVDVHRAVFVDEFCVFFEEIIAYVEGEVAIDLPGAQVG